MNSSSIGALRPAALGPVAPTLLIRNKTEIELLGLLVRVVLVEAIHRRPPKMRPDPTIPASTAERRCSPQGRVLNLRPCPLAFTSARSLWAEAYFWVRMSVEWTVTDARPAHRRPLSSHRMQQCQSPAEVDPALVPARDDRPGVGGPHEYCVLAEARPDRDSVVHGKPSAATPSSRWPDSGSIPTASSSRWARGRSTDSSSAPRRRFTSNPGRSGPGSQAVRMGTGADVGQGHRPIRPGGAARTVTRSSSAGRTISTMVLGVGHPGVAGREQGHRSAP